MTTRQRRPAPDFQPARPLGGIHPDPLVTGTAVSDLDDGRGWENNKLTKRKMPRRDSILLDTSLLVCREPRSTKNHCLKSPSTKDSCHGRVSFAVGLVEGVESEGQGPAAGQTVPLASTPPPPGRRLASCTIYSAFPCWCFNRPSPAEEKHGFLTKHLCLLAANRPTSQRRNRNDGNDEPPIWFPILDPSTHLRHVMSSDEGPAQKESPMTAMYL